MTEQSRNNAAAAERRYRTRGVIAGVVILLCLAFLVWNFWPKPEPVIAPHVDQAAEWDKSFAAINSEHASKVDAMYKLLGKIAAHPSEDRSKIVISGKVSNAAELNALKAEVAKVQPQMPLDWQVTVGQ